MGPPVGAPPLPPGPTTRAQLQRYDIQSFSTPPCLLLREQHKREIFYGIQQGGRIDPKTGRLIKAGDTKNVTNDVTQKLTERQRVILEMLPFGDIENVTKNERVTTALLAGRFGKDPRTIKRDMKVLQDLGIVTHVGPSNGGYWKRLK